VNTQVAEKPMTFMEAINAALTDAMAENDKVIVLGEDIGDAEGGGVFGATRGLSTRFGETRARATPISEQAIMGAAIGASLVGYRPVAEIMLMNFTTVAMDMIVNHAAKLRFMSGGQTHVPIVVRTMTGSGLSSGGQHADYLEAWFAHTAGLKVVIPSNPIDAYGLLLAAIDDPDPVIFVEHTLSYFSKPASTGRPAQGERIPLGKAKITRSGTDITIVSYSHMANESLAAAEALAAEGISTEVIDLRTIAPWDRNAVLASVTKTGRLLIVHEAVKPFGVGAEIAADIGNSLFGKLKSPIERVGGAFSPVPFTQPLERAFAPDRARIAQAAKALVKA
jgi:acetoin:2,6-dichlorophenolindophenol oxidoreductase subunit beta